MNLERGEIILLENGKEFIILDEIQENEDVYLFLMSNYKPLELKLLKKTTRESEAFLENFNDSEKKEKLLQRMQQKYNI